MRPQNAPNRVLKGSYGGQTKCCYQKRCLITVKKILFAPLFYGAYCTCRSTKWWRHSCCWYNFPKPTILNMPLILVLCQIWVGCLSTWWHPQTKILKTPARRSSRALQAVIGASGLNRLSMTASVKPGSVHHLDDDEVEWLLWKVDRRLRKKPHLHAVDICRVIPDSD